MSIRRWTAATTSVLALTALAACGSSESPDTVEPAADTADSSEQDASEQDDQVAQVTSIGGEQALTDGEGNALYLFTKDEPNTSNCADDCLAAWPALEDPITAGDGVDETKLDTIERSEGGTQVTYAGKPLYYFAMDKQPGDTRGQGVKDVWFLVDAEGEAIGNQGDESATADAGETTTTVQLGRLNGQDALTDEEGNALYVFAKDEANASNCVDDVCRETWPVLAGPATAGAGINGDELGAIEREDGTEQVTYFGKPLYYHVRDKEPGDILGNGFKGLWCLVDVDGQAIKE